MQIRYTREYEIQFDGTAAQFIELIDKELRFRSDAGLDSLDMGDAVHAAADLFEAGYIPTIIGSTGNAVYGYIDCPDKSTVLHHNADDDSYSVVTFPCRCNYTGGLPFEPCPSRVPSSEPKLICDGCKATHSND